jgi:hypothetical protein
MLRTRIATAVSLALLVLTSSTQARAQAAPTTAPPPVPAPNWPQSPAQGADPPELPPPTGTTPLSTSGTDVQPPGNLMPTAPLVANDARSGNAFARVRALETRVAVDEARIRALDSDVSPFRHLRLMGYTQLQYTFQSNNAAASPNLQSNGALPPGISSNDVIARPDGTTTNANMFRLRRTRFGATYETDVVRVFLQAELLPLGGPASTSSTIARNAEATGIAHWSKNVRTEFTGGLFAMPIRMELEETSLMRPFIERTWASLNLFPTERDLGIHARTIAWNDRLIVDVGIVNGQRLGEPLFALDPDLNGSKDFFGSLSAKKLGPFDVMLSGYFGRGQVIDPNLLRIKNYDRYALNFAARFAHTFVRRLGETRVMGEALFGRNMDTGVVYSFATPAIPPSFTEDIRGLTERAVYVRAEQDLTHWGIVGFRFDSYIPDVAVQNDGRDTYTFMLGARFSKNLRLINELAYAIDNVHFAAAPPPSKHLLQYSAWLQASFY